ncbi:biotin--[acetyl-CoA-carboxylase] ligase [Rhodococcus sp. ACPA4]|jgi:BirA family biotin operon repressor/biotin-[acetyl-CoA-carboxylase] ligase|uniref:biotin--[acetyl-CoA-carboxylase] ligase n=1 Tax=Rhodococcus TaxID=1827 RepID=UPI000BB15AD1|nr:MULTISPECIES: biotin--[acetyl-CoA-carboxylase] ligase [Rhodococcus]PBC41784.1 biotin--[acetyl-CoA-carboxylase] ligase [Rhodococcus sp. ACPA4]QXW03933.1 biotin--[acetyl-CoA-carboxylase] ligase [Rhodococcus globerulus]ROZ48914.1 biotin--[acetyl-CoA-carboxylase] ligase [Rhodococcus sp. WS3]RZL22413.1 MAG: biotin--[acetyl-CoA-carboxylase] ligase [Rhodococcus sp. (in: high G+C Gram-positive bacteria)]
MWTDLNRPPLDQASLRRALVRSDGGSDARAFWNRLDVVESTGSTNADLLARASDPGADRHVLIAEYQESARGRHARTWVSPAQAQISMSVLLGMPGLNLADMGWLPLLTGIAVVDALRTVAEVPAELKWPNDVLIGDKKVAGILAEVARTTPEPAVVVGIGLNVSLGAEELPVPTATSLLLENAETVDRDTLVRALARELARQFRGWENSGWDTGALAAEYRERCGTLGKRVRAVLPGDKEVFGTATDIDTSGRVVIEIEGSGGETFAVAAGDITHLRAAPITD